jgi:hypothetical protein
MSITLVINNAEEYDFKCSEQICTDIEEHADEPGKSPSETDSSGAKDADFEPSSAHEGEDEGPGRAVGNLDGCPHEANVDEAQNHGSGERSAERPGARGPSVGRPARATVGARAKSRARRVPC